MGDRISMLQKFILVLIITSLCIQISVSDSSTYHNLSDNEFVISDDSGPSFLIPIQYTFLDCAWPEGIHEFSVDTHVTVTDSDGVDMVIGSHRCRNRTQWTNISLARIESESSVYAFSFTETVDLKCSDGGLIIFEMVFYANDSLGNWAKSDIANYTQGAVYNNPPTSDSSNTTTFDSTDIPSSIPWALPVVFFLAGIFLFTSLCYIKRK